MNTDTTTMISRVNQLWAFQSDELTKQMQFAAQKTVREHAARGLLHSGNLISSLASIQQNNFPKAVGNAWEALRETHQAMGGDTTPETRLAMQCWMTEIIGKHQVSAATQIKQHIAQYAAHLLNRQMLQVDDTETVANALRSRFEAIIDNHLDQIMNNPATGASVTINAQTIGAVLTGDRALAHITQNIEATTEMRELLAMMREVLKRDSALSLQQRTDLVDIADDASAELDKPNPNETKLMTLFTLLTQSVQTLPAALPAYQAAKALLATCGINL